MTFPLSGFLLQEEGCGKAKGFELHVKEQRLVNGSESRLADRWKNGTGSMKKARRSAPSRRLYSRLLIGLLQVFPSSFIERCLAHLSY